VAIKTGSMEGGLGQEKICVKRQYDLYWLNLHEKWKSTLNAYLNKTLQRERRKSFLKQ